MNVCTTARAIQSPLSLQNNIQLRHSASSPGINQISPELQGGQNSRVATVLDRISGGLDVFSLCWESH